MRNRLRCLLCPGITKYFLAFILSVFALLPLGAANAQTVIQVQTNQAVITLPENLTFKLSTTSGSTITSITLEYGTNSQSCVVGVARQKADFKAGKSVEAEWVWDFKTGGGSLPPGAEVWWLWEIKDESGAVLRTEKQTLTVEDNRLQWRTLENEQVKIVWSDGGTSFGKRMLQISTDAINRLANNAGIKPPGQIRLTIFPSQQALIDALLFVPEWTGGVAFPEYATTAMEISVNADPAWENNVIPHELAHLVTGQLTFNCLGSSMPTWLSEGISVYNEGPKTDIDLDAPVQALKNGGLPPLRNFASGFSADSGEALLSYGYSGVIVTYLIETYGTEKLANLLKAIQDGKLINPALQSVYGFDTDGLDEAWRASLGYGSGTGGSAATSVPTTIPTSVPTIALATSAFGSGGKTSKPTTTPTNSTAAKLTPIPSNTATLTAIAPTAQVTIEPTQTSTAQPMPDNQRPAPLSCLGVNAAIGSGMVFFATAFSRRKRDR